MPEDDFERTPPHDVAAEQCTLGGMLLAPSAITDVIDIIGPDAHYRPAHTLIHEAILDLFARGEPADAITVANLLTERGQITRVGGAVYLHTLIAAVPTAANAGYYAKIVRERATLRRLIETGTRITQYGYAADADADTLVNRAQADVYGLTTFRNASALIQFGDLMLPAGQELEEAAARALDSETGVIGIPTGLVDLDKLLNGLYGGQLIMIAARPALGKSTLGVNWGQYAAKHGYCTAIFSLEMGRIELATRILSAEARVPHHTMRSGRLSDDEWTRIARRMGDLAHVPLWIDDTPGLSLAELRAKCRLLKTRNQLRLVIVDYLQLMTTNRRKESNRAQEVGELSTGLKILAKELDVPVVALSQLNRGPETRQDKKPVLSDLRESGNLEQDSDVVILLHREDAYERESARAGEADLIVAKHRNGPVATVTAAFQGHYCRFVDMGPVG